MSDGYFGIHGGQYIPETLMNAVLELEQAYDHYKRDPGFQAELTGLLNNYTGRPSLLYFAEKMSRDGGDSAVDWGCIRIRIEMRRINAFNFFISISFV